MADLRVALNKTLKNEGLYGNDPDDIGKETCFGIARNMNPHWAGWAIIDKAKSRPDFPHSLESNEDLQRDMVMFYTAYFWNKIRGDEIQDQEVANQLFDTAVNTGVIPAIKMMQETLNVPVNGIMNDETIKAINS